MRRQYSLINEHQELLEYLFEILLFYNIFQNYNT